MHNRVLYSSSIIYFPSFLLFLWGDWRAQRARSCVSIMLLRCGWLVLDLTRQYCGCSWRPTRHCYRCLWRPKRHHCRCFWRPTRHCYRCLRRTIRHCYRCFWRPIRCVADVSRYPLSLNISPTVGGAHVCVLAVHSRVLSWPHWTGTKRTHGSLSYQSLL